MSEYLDHLFSLPRAEFEKECSAHASGPACSWARVFGKEGVDIKLVEGDTGISPVVARDGYWESWVNLALAKLVRPGMTVWDIGANIGYYMAMFRLLVGESGRVIAFEPQKAVVNALRLTVEEAEWQNVEVVEGAVGRTRGTVNFHIPRGLLGTASVLPIEDSVETTVDMCSLDDLGGKPDLILCDAEGSEQDIFLGSRLIAKHRPVVALEFLPVRYTAPRALVEFFRELGYYTYRIAFDGSLRAFDPEICIEANTWTMLVFIPIASSHADNTGHLPIVHHEET